MKKSLKVGLITAVAAVSMSIGAVADTALEEIKAYLNKGVSIELKGNAWTPKDEDGNVLHPITYNGSTYLPVRAVGEAVGLKVGWNAETQTVVLGEGQPAEKVPEGSYKVGDFTFTDVTVKSGIIGPEIAAEVKSSKDVKGATFTITFYGADDKRIGTAMGSVQNLKSGESKTLQFMTSDDGVEKYKSMKFQVDLQY